MSAIQHALSDSERSKFYSCRRLWLYAQFLRLRRKLVGGPRRVGGLWHHGMDALWGATPLHGVSLERAKEAVREQHQADLEFLPQGGAYEAEANYNLPTEGELKAEAALVLQMLDGYEKAHDLGAWRVMYSEHRLIAPTPAWTGRPSWFSQVLGILDKVVEWEGALWLVEHKTYADTLSDWRGIHDYLPQAPTYGWLAKQHGIKLAGVIYDLALRKVPPAPEAFKINQNGSPSKSLPSGLTEEALVDFLDDLLLRGTCIDPADPKGKARMLAEVQGEGVDWKPGEWPDWAEEKIAEVRAEPKEYFKRELVRFSHDDLELGEELHTAATEIRRARQDLLRTIPAQVMEELRSPKQEDRLAAALVIARTEQHRHPRNGGNCYRWGKPCEHMDFCRYGSLESLSGMEVRHRDESRADAETDNTASADAAQETRA